MHGAWCIGVATAAHYIMASTTGIGLKEKELETKAVNNCLDNLSEHLDIDPVLDKLLSKELISAEKHSEIAKMVVDGKRRQAVRNAIEEIGLKPPGSLKSFIEVLKEDKKTKYLGDHVDEGIYIVILSLFPQCPARGAQIHTTTCNKHT